MAGLTSDSRGIGMTRAVAHPEAPESAKKLLTARVFWRCKPAAGNQGPMPTCVGFDREAIRHADCKLNRSETRRNEGGNKSPGSRQ